jgi:hypothetical protein
MLCPPLIIIIILGEEYKLISLLCGFLHHAITPSLFGPNILLTTLFSNTLSLCSSLNVRDQRWVGFEECMERKRNSKKLSIATSGGRIQLPRHQCKWEYSAMSDFNKMGQKGLDSIHFTQDKINGRP